MYSKYTPKEFGMMSEEFATCILQATALSSLYETLLNYPDKSTLYCTKEIETWNILTLSGMKICNNSSDEIAAKYVNLYFTNDYVMLLSKIRHHKIELFLI